VFIGTEFNEWSRKFQQMDDDIPATNKCGRIVWLDKQTRENTLSAFRESDAFVLSSSLETQPISILESMSFGKPWIGRKAGCMASLPGGLCVTSQLSMSKAMSKIAGNPDLRSKLSQEGLQAASEVYSLRKNAVSYNKMLAEILTAS
jgi:glycosyltransferase involved in cell wall biosynthesis